jgi:hypothetical protein
VVGTRAIRALGAIDGKTEKQLSKNENIKTGRRNGGNNHQKNPKLSKKC